MQTKGSHNQKKDAQCERALANVWMSLKVKSLRNFKENWSKNHWNTKCMSGFGSNEDGSVDITGSLLVVIFKYVLGIVHSACT